MAFVDKEKQLLRKMMKFLRTKSSISSFGERVPQVGGEVLLQCHTDDCGAGPRDKSLNRSTMNRNDNTILDKF